MQKHVLSFDLETVPDYDLARSIDPEALADKTDDEVNEWLGKNRNTSSMLNFPKLLFHKVVCASFTEWSRDSGISITSLVGEEKPLLSDFFDVIKVGGGPDKAQLVSYNGKGFDLPTAMQRAMIHNVKTHGTFYQSGDYKWNNYVGRYLDAHVDLMDAGGLYQSNARNRLGDITTAIGLPGKIGVGGPNVAEAYAEGKLDDIKDYCEMDTILTMMTFIRYQEVTNGLCVKLKEMKMDFVEFFGENHENELINVLAETWDYAKWLR